MPKRSPALSLFAVVFTVVFFILSYTFSQVFGNAVADQATAWIGQVTGLPADAVGKLIGNYVVPAFVSGMCVWAAFLTARWYLQQTEFADDPNTSALSLPAMSVTEIAEYIRDKSDLGWRLYAELNLWEFVKDQVPSEMTRAGRAGQVRYIGTAPNSANAIEIDRSYWQHAFIHSDKIWDSRNTFFTWVASNSGVFPPLWAYQFGMAPRIDVLRTWPKASMMRRISAVLWVRIKKAYYWFTAILRLS